MGNEPTRRPSLEQNFYEIVSMDHVHTIDVNAHPIEEVNAAGIKTDLGQIDVDLTILATITDHWKNGIRTAMSIPIPESTNMSFLCGP